LAVSALPSLIAVEKPLLNAHKDKIDKMNKTVMVILRPTDKILFKCGRLGFDQDVISEKAGMLSGRDFHPTHGV